MRPLYVGPVKRVSAVRPVNDVVQFIRATPVTADHAQVRVATLSYRCHDLRA